MYSHVASSLTRASMSLALHMALYRYSSVTKFIGHPAAQALGLGSQAAESDKDNV